MDKQQFIDFARVLNEKIEMPKEGCDVIYSVADDVFADESILSNCLRLDEALRSGTYDIGGLVQEYIDEIGYDEDKFYLFMCEFNAYFTKDKCKEFNWTEDIFYDSMRDITIWGHTCLLRTGSWGMLNYKWVVSLLSCKLVRLGRLQFHKITYDRGLFQRAGVTVRPGDKVINIHIPEGDSLSKEKRIDAYKKAYSFFNMSGKAVFVCNSWLFYEKHREFLPPTSNILSFMNDFSFVEYKESHDLKDMWRIFGYPEHYDDLTKLPRNTGLQRAYADWLVEHGTTGGAYGVFVFDGEKIL